MYDLLDLKASLLNSVQDAILPVKSASARPETAVSDTSQAGKQGELCLRTNV